MNFNFFLSLPLPLSTDAQQTLQAFRDALLLPLSTAEAAAAAAAPAAGLDRSIFVDHSRLHLTLVMLKLYSDDARHRAAATLQSLKPKVGGVCGEWCACMPELGAV